jgi:hypothetical protein
VIVDAAPPADRQSYLANGCEVLSIELFCVHAGCCLDQWPGQRGIGLECRANLRGSEARGNHLAGDVDFGQSRST